MLTDKLPKYFAVIFPSFSDNVLKRKDFELIKSQLHKKVVREIIREMRDA